MKKIKLNASITVFLLFFGTAVLEAFRTRNWVNAGFWVVMSVFFLLLGNMTKEDQNQHGQKLSH